VNRRRLFELKRDFLMPQRLMMERIDAALRGRRGPARMSSQAFLGGMIYLLRDGQQPTLTRLFRLFDQESTSRELKTFGLKKAPTYAQLRWALHCLATYSDVKADKTLPQVVALQALLGVPGQSLMASFLDCLVGATVPDSASSPMRTVDGSYVDGHCRPMKAELIPMALKAEAVRLPVRKRLKAEWKRLEAERRWLKVEKSPSQKELEDALEQMELEVKPPADRDARPRTISRPAGGTRHYMGYVLTAQRRINPDREYIEKIRVGPANDHEYEHGLAMLQRSRAEGMDVQYFLADRGFSQNPTFRSGVRNLDIDLVFDVKSDQRGPDGTWHGCLVIDGWPYLPSLPENLRDLKGLPITGTRTQKAAWKQQMAERDRYALILKERVNARRIRVTSPALLTPPGKGQRGPGCLHPDLVATMRWRDESLLGICPGDHAADEACGLKNATWSANFSERTNRNFSAVPFGSRAWQELYPGRSASERGFNIFKNSDMIGLLKGRIRWRGLPRVTLLFGMAVAAHNLWLTNVPAAAASPPQKRPMVRLLAA
jgi:hypothetical protein